MEDWHVIASVIIAFGVVERLVTTYKSEIKDFVRFVGAALIIAVVLHACGVPF